MSQIKIFIIIPTFNRRNSLKILIDQLLSQENDLIHLTIIVVVDRSTDGTFEMLAEYDKIEIVKGNGNWWFTKCLNEGLNRAKELKAQFIMTFNDDLEIPNDYLKIMTKSYIKLGYNNIVAPLQFVNDDRKIIFGSGIKRIIWWRFKYIPHIKKFSQVDRSKLTGLHPTILTTTRGMLTSMDIIESLNYFDDHLVQYGSDDDFCLRAHKKGYGLYISHDTELYVNVEKTAVGSTNNKSSFYDFIKSLFIRYSNNHIGYLTILIRKHSNVRFWIFPLTITLAGRLKNHLKRNYFS